MLCSATLWANAAAEVKPMIVVDENSKELPSATQITVNGRFCKVHVVNADDGVNAVSGKLEAITDDEAYKVIIDDQGATATVNIEVPEKAFSSFVGQITVKAKSGTTVNIVNNSGYVEAEGLSGVTINAETSQGRITARNCKADLTLTTKNGDVKLEDVEGKSTITSFKGALSFKNIGGSVTIDSQDGAIVADKITGDFNAKSVAGTITITNLSGNTNLKSSSGAVKISNSKGVFTVSTNSAAVNLFEVAAEMHIQSVRGPIVGQKGITLTASSDFTNDEGKIQLRLANNKDDLTFALTCETSKSSLIAKGTSKKKKLNSGNGPIVVTGKTKTGSQVYS